MLDGMWYLDINDTSTPNQHNTYQENSVHEIKKKEEIVIFFQHYVESCTIYLNKSY